MSVIVVLAPRYEWFRRWQQESPIERSKARYASRSEHLRGLRDASIVYLDNIERCSVMADCRNEEDRQFVRDLVARIEAARGGR